MKMFLLSLFFGGGGPCYDMMFNNVISFSFPFVILNCVVSPLYLSWVRHTVSHILPCSYRSFYIPSQENKQLFYTEHVSPASVTYRQTGGHSQNVTEVTPMCQPAYTDKTTLCQPAWDTRSKGFTEKSLFVNPCVNFTYIPYIHQSLHIAGLQRCIICHFQYQL